jgi:hypothetical protein
VFIVDSHLFGGECCEFSLLLLNFFFKYNYFGREGRGGEGRGGDGRRGEQIDIIHCKE